jgi:sigma-B regulation protein RsbU (phosphoserine phosphatase)
MGHGVRAALVVAMLRGLLATQANGKHDASQFLGKLNSGLSSILKRANVTMFATAFYGIIDLNELSMEYSCAGHPGPIVVGEKSSQQLCTARGEKGPALGLMNHLTYPIHTLDLSDFQRLLLFTDGVLEAENDEGEQFMDKRLLQTASQDPQKDIEEWLESVIETVLDFSDSHHFDDDVCLLGIHIVKPG